jgi:hypothetical protein
MVKQRPSAPQVIHTGRAGASTYRTTSARLRRAGRAEREFCSKTPHAIAAITNSRIAHDERYFGITATYSAPLWLAITSSNA